MIKTYLFILSGILIGLSLGYWAVFYTPLFALDQTLSPLTKLNPFATKNTTIGFLPYWLLTKAQADYSKYFNTLTYFSLTIGDDGKIQTLTNPQESEPGWLTLNSGKADPFFQTAKNHGQTLSLLVFNGSQDSITALLSDPITHAQNLVSDITPIMKKYNFKDLNLDIESPDVASDEARTRFTQFATELKKGLGQNQLGTLTIDISPTAYIKKYLINPQEIVPIADHIVIMTYDYHYSGSFVTGPISPLGGGGALSEFDVQTAINQALLFTPPKKIILGIPVYGYEWETIQDATRSATIPGSGAIASDNRVEQLLSNCASCSATFDSIDKEPHIIYQDQNTGTFHQIFYTDKNAVQAKIDFINKLHLGGLAVWALGYESSSVLDPLASFK